MLHPPTPEVRLAEVFARLSRLDLRYGRCVGGPIPGSGAARDCVTEFGQQAWVLSMVGTSVAIDHLKTWQRVRERIWPSFGHLTLLRAAIEGSVLVRWLADPRITTELRMRRGAAAQFYDLDEWRKWEGKRTGLWSARGKPASERIAELKRELESQKLKPLEWPGDTALCARYAVAPEAFEGGERLYRILSAFAHGRQWPVVRWSYWEDFGPSPGLTETRMMRVTTGMPLALEATRAALDTLDAALGDLEAYGGLERVPLPPKPPAT